MSRFIAPNFSNKITSLASLSASMQKLSYSTLFDRVVWRRGKDRFLLCIDLPRLYSFCRPSVREWARPPDAQKKPKLCKEQRHETYFFFPHRKFVFRISFCVRWMDLPWLTNHTTPPPQINPFSSRGISGNDELLFDLEIKHYGNAQCR